MSENILVEGEAEIWRNAQWRVTNMHLEEIHDGSTMGPPYWIAHTDLSRPGWIEHMSEKNWVDRELFTEAYGRACEVAGIKPPIARAGFDPAAVHHAG